MPLNHLVRFLVVFLLLIVGDARLSAQDYHLTRHFTTEDGLAGSIARNGFMDSKGYLWISTFNGLSRYDGTTFKNYYHDPTDPNSLCWNSTGGFAEDDADHLWIATGKGLAMFDYATETFSCYTNDPSDSTSISGNLVQGVFQDSEKHLWVFTHSAGMNLFDKKTGTFKPFLLRPEISIPHYNWVYNTVNAIAEDIENPDILWLAGHRNGLHKFNKSTQKLTRLNVGIFEEHIVFMDKPGELWIGTWGHGLLKLNTKTLEWQQLKGHAKTTKDLPSDQLIITDIKSRGGPLLYLATNSYGVVVYNRETKEFSTLIPNVKDVLSMDERAVVKILFDDQDRLWAFSYSGVFLFDPNTVFIKSQKVPLKNLSMSRFGHIISDIDVDVDGNYWISSTFGNGVYKMSPDRKKIVPIEIALGKNSLVDNRCHVRNILVDKKGNVWIIDGNTQLLAKYNPTTDRFEAFKPEKYRKLFKRDFYPDNLQEDSEGNLWMAASFAGLIKYEFDRDTFKHFVSWEEDEQMLDSRVAINKIYFDSKDNIWISTGAYGIYVFDTRREKFSRRFFPEYGNVKYERKFLGIVEAPDGKIWTSRQNLGIRVIDPAMPDNQKGGLITHKDGLPATVFGMEKDTSGSLWMATRRGLVKYDFDKKKFRVFGKQEGFSDLFDWNLPFKVIRTGEVFLGKKDGTFYLFHPDSLPFNRKPPPLVFTKFEVLGKEKHFAKSLDYLEEVTLPYAENFFTLTFAALNFTNPEDNQYRYILEGYDKEWSNSGNRNFAAYTNVREGSYLFRVKAANNDGVWNEEGISLKIKILPPWYRSWWAYGLYALLWVGGIFAAYRFQRRRWKLRSQLALEQAEATRLKELDETKSRLYTNITHEFRTPLTVILGLTEQLKLKPKIKWENYLNAIHRNGSQLLDLINQLLDLNKLQSGTMKPEYVQGNVVAYLNYLTASYQSFAFSQNKSLAFFADPDSFQMDYDPEKMQRILGNILSNAIKFTPEYGSIKVEAKGRNDSLTIKVSDTGIGISKENLPHIFDRFHQVDATTTRKGEGTGIGLALAKEMVELLGGRIKVESKVGRGTTFTISLPVTHTAAMETNIRKDFFIAMPASESNLKEKKASPNSSVTTPVWEQNEKPLLLIIEDNTDVTEYLQACLGNGYHFLTARNGKEGVETALEKVPDIIISDVMMPEMDGFEVCEKLKTDPRTSHVPIILLTAKATVEDRIAGLSCGADAYLAKPFNKEELCVRLDKLVELRKQMQEYFTAKSISEKSEPDSPEEAFLQRLVAVIHEHLDEEDFDVPRLCRSIAMSRTQLHRKIKALTGQSTTEYVRNTRLREAKRLLETTEMSVSEVAYQVGFRHPNNFSTAFKNYFGYSPGETHK